jgi:hypothetical protein
MAKYVAKGQVSGTSDEGSLVVSPIEPHYATKKFTVAIPSEVSRGSQAQGTWDKFDILFAMFASRASDFVIVVHTEGLKIAPKTALRVRPPTSEHFRAIGDSSVYQAEYIAAASVARFIAGASSRYKVEAEGFSSQDEGPFKCSSQVEF